MIELPEALTLAAQLEGAVKGKTVSRVLPPTKPHKFCWFGGDPADYNKQICGSKVISSEGFGIYVELAFDNGRKLCVNDGVNMRFGSADAAPRDYQLLIVFEDGAVLAFTVAMYGGIVLHGDDYDNDYYLKSRSYISPFSPGFEKYFSDMIGSCGQTLSAKAFLATEQRFPGIGNGVLQDILFSAGVYPKRKISTLDDTERRKLFNCTVSVLRDMTERGGRDTEKDIYGNAGGYTTKMSRKSLADGCPGCHGGITKESYLGGTVYYCPDCQR